MYIHVFHSVSFIKIGPVTHETFYRETYADMGEIIIVHHLIAEGNNPNNLVAQLKSCYQGFIG